MVMLVMRMFVRVMMVLVILVQKDTGHGDTG